MAIAVFRRAPKSFTDQRYYSWMAFEYKAKDGVPRYAKFRLVPADAGREETGLLTEYDQRKPWLVLYIDYRVLLLCEKAINHFANSGF